MQCISFWIVCRFVVCPEKNLDLHPPPLPPPGREFRTDGNNRTFPAKNLPPNFFVNKLDPGGGDTLIPKMTAPGDTPSSDASADRRAFPKSHE